MEITGFVSRYSRLCLKLAPLAVLAFIWLWFLIAVYIIGLYDEPLKALQWWNALI